MKAFLVVLLALWPAIAMGEDTSSLSYLCSNSETGTGGGLKVRADGQISYLVQTKGAKRLRELPARKDADVAAKMFALAESNGFLDSSYDRGRCSITYHTAEKEHTVNYGAKAPKPIKEVFNKMHALYRSDLDRGK